VLEHVCNPDFFLQKIINLLTENGQLLIGIPNMNGLYSRIFKKYSFNRDVPRHIFNYNNDNLKILFHKHNMQILKISYHSYGGLLGSMQNFINDKFKLKINLWNNNFLIILLFPLDFLCNLFNKSDNITILLKKII
jgi:hypothetical protein